MLSSRTTPFVPAITTAIVGEADGEHYIFVIKSDELTR